MFYFAIAHLFGTFLSFIWYFRNLCRERKAIIKKKAFLETFIIFQRNLDAFKFFSSFYESFADQIYAFDAILYHDLSQF